METRKKEKALKPSTSLSNTKLTTGKKSKIPKLNIALQKQSRPININLLPKFDSARRNPSISLEKCLILNTEEKVKENITNEEIINEILNKLNNFKQAINFKVHQHQMYLSEVKSFVEFFMSIFSGTGQCDIELLNQIKESLNRIGRSLEIYSKVESFYISQEERFRYEELITEATQLFEYIDQCFNKINPCEITQIVDDVKSYSLKIDTKDSSSFPQKIIREKNLPNELMDTSLMNNHISKSISRQEKLSDTVFIKKSKRLYGEDDIVSKENHQTHDKTSKLFLRNFLQIYYIKEGGIFSETHFENSKLGLPSSYNKFRFYQLKLYLSVEESFTCVKMYLNTIRRLFIRHIILFKADSSANRRYIKILFAGYGKRQALMKRYVINMMSGEVKMDCVCKISFYSNIFDCLALGLRKFYNKKDYFIYTNYADNALKKIISSIDLLSKDL